MNYMQEHLLWIIGIVLLWGLMQRWRATRWILRILAYWFELVAKPLIRLAISLIQDAVRMLFQLIILLLQWAWKIPLVRFVVLVFCFISSLVITWNYVV